MNIDLEATRPVAGRKPERRDRGYFRRCCAEVNQSFILVDRLNAWFNLSTKMKD